MTSEEKEAFSLYKRYFIQSSILESVARHHYLESDLNKEIMDRMTNAEEISWGTTAHDINKEIAYLIAIDLIGANKDEVIIKNTGLEALQGGTFQQMATAAFFNYKTLKWSIKLSRISLIAAIGSISAAFIGMLVLLLN